MKPINPKTTIQNMDGPQMLVSLQHEFGEEETLLITVKVQKDDQSLSEIHRQALERAALLLNALLGKQG